MNGHRNRPLWSALAGIAAFLLIWQAATSVFAISEWLLPSPWQVAKEAFVSADRVWMHSQSTAMLAAGGFALSVAMGLLCAVLLHLFPLLRELAQPFLILSQSVPSIVLAPLLVLWLGFGIMPKLVIIVLVCFFPVLIAALGGFAQADRTMLQYLQMIGSSRLQIFRKLEFPGALPALFSGLRISATYSITGAVIAEWLGAEKGIGVYMTLASSSYRADRVFVAIGVIVALSLLLFGLVQVLERYLIPWNRKGGRGKVHE
ncbi:ABC transporter permease [Paenibacillus gansuensis]|uniref:ABC transporter permease n=1 Tax=Paenibacillus gansuensis TaxID=306542 RepID=A0ABW5PAM1_9BACL